MFYNLRSSRSLRLFYSLRLCGYNVFFASSRLCEKYNLSVLCVPCVQHVFALTARWSPRHLPLKKNVPSSAWRIAKHIILYSENLINEWNLNKYKNKIKIAHRHFINFEDFSIKKKYSERDEIIGYIGRFSEEKGILNFVKAIDRRFAASLKTHVVAVAVKFSKQEI